MNRTYTILSRKKRALNIIRAAKRFLGKPYKFGAKTGNIKEFDCSSLVQYIYRKYGVNLPRVSRNQAKRGRRVPVNLLQKGDLLFYWSNKTGEGNVGHVSIYVGGQKVLHATPKYGVHISPYIQNDTDNEIYFMWAKRVF